MLKGLREVEVRLNRLKVDFEIISWDPGVMIPSYVNSVKAGILVTDFNPLKISLEWKEAAGRSIHIPFIEVDAHNILPCRAISDKFEYAAFTLRKKVEKHLSEFLTEFPVFVNHPTVEDQRLFGPADWDALLNTLVINEEVPEPGWIIPGETAAHAALASFLKKGLETYAQDRNFPEREGQSGLSPWLHFGHLSAQRVALEVQKAEADHASKMALLEELIVRRELADNFCLHNPGYDHTGGFQPWAKKTRFAGAPPPPAENSQTRSPTNIPQAARLIRCEDHPGHQGRLPATGNAGKGNDPPCRYIHIKPLEIMGKGITDGQTGLQLFSSR